MNSEYRWDLKPPNDQDIKYQFEKDTTSVVLVSFDGIDQILQDLYQFLDPFLKYYPWIDSSPRFEVQNHTFINKDGNIKTIEYIYGELINDGEYFDENLLIQILLEFSKLNSCFIHIWNSTEYEVILIHTFEVAQDWLLDRTASMNRTWLHDGKVIVLNNHGDGKFLPLQRAISQLQNQDYVSNIEMTTRLKFEIKQDYNLSNIYDISIKLSKNHYQILSNSPNLISRCIKNAAYDDDYINQDISQCDELIVLPIHAVRLAEIYIQLMNHQELLPNIIASKILTYGLNKLQINQVVKDKDDPFSRDMLQNELIKQGRLSNPISSDLNEFFQAFDSEGLDDTKQNALIEEFSGFLNNKSNVEKILQESDILEDNETSSSDEEDVKIGVINHGLKQLENSEFSDFLNYFIENDETNRKRKKQYNDDSDYESDSDLEEFKYLQVDHDVYETYQDVADKSDVLDDEEDLTSPYTDDEEMQKKIREYLQSKGKIQPGIFKSI